MPQYPDTLRDQRDRLLDRLTAILEADQRVRAAWLSGSFGRGTEDGLSDLDLHLAVDDRHLEHWLAARPILYAQIGNPLLVRADKPSNAGPGPFQEVLFGGPVTLDLNVHPASAARRGIDTRVLFDRLPLPPVQPAPQSDEELRARLRQAVEFFWAMTAIALKYVARGHTHRAVTQLDLLLGVYVDAWRAIHQPNRLDAGGAHWLHPVHDAALHERLPALGERIDRAAVLDAISHLTGEMEAQRPELVRLGVEVPSKAVDEITRFRNSIAAGLPACTERVTNDT